jgi:hypothetical protein
MMAQPPRLLLLLADTTLARAVLSSCAGTLDVTSVATMDEAIEQLRQQRYTALAWSESEHGDDAVGFPELVRHLSPGLRIISAQAHLAPHLVTLARMRPNPTRNWSARPPVGVALVDALIASADDPVFGGPHVN